MSNPGPLLREVRPRLARIQAPVKDRLEVVLDELRRIVLSDFEMIEEVNQYLLLMRGKLFRPTLLLLSNQVGDQPSPEADTLAALVELVHLATLVHDDAVDHSVLRRGLPTVNALWTHGVAVIMGDYLYSRSVLELVRLRNLDAMQALARAANEMSIGEMRQLTSNYDALDFSEAAYLRLISAKTASLTCAACEMGAMVGVEAYRDPLARFGHNLGMAFQIADDLLDYTGSEAQTGKPVSHDLRERKVTLPLVGALQSATPAAESAIRSFFTLADPGEEEIQRIIQIVEELGGLEFARTRARSFADRAEDALSELESGPATDALRESVAYAIDRSR